VKIIAETAFHHDGDYPFMTKLVDALCASPADVVKIHILLNIDQYMLSDHPAYEFIKERLFTSDQWRKIIETIRASGKGLMTLLNDVAAAELAAGYSPELVELHSVALNDKSLLDAVKGNFSRDTKVVLGVGGSTLYEIENAARLFDPRQVVLMFGFQNYPTRYEDVNFRKVRRIMAAFPEFEYGYADHTAWNEPSNVLISLLGAAQGMGYLEKHVTVAYGEDRTDYSAAISLDMLAELKNGLDILSACNGDGLLALNAAEKKYCVPGAMKKAAVLVKDVVEGDVLTWDSVVFSRTGQTSDLSQIDIWNSIGRKFSQSISAGTSINSNHLSVA